MSNEYNGGNIVWKKRRKSSTEADEASSSGGQSDTVFTPETSLRGFVKIPFVKLTRHNVASYLKRCKLHRENHYLHLKKLSQKCYVKLKKDDLEKLKSSFRSKPDTSISSSPPDSDSETSNFTGMAMKCKICDKTYNSEKKLLNHQQNKHIIYKTEHSKPQKRVSFSDHVIVHEVKEYHKCRKCPKIFEDYKSLKTHMKRWHKKRKCYICNYCDKNFVDRMFFKVHIRLHCDVCGKLLPNKSQYLEHRRNICRVLKLHKCKTCNASFFKIMDLKDHSYEHEGLCYVCDVCKDQFPSKCAIAHHNLFLHSKKPPKELYSMIKMGTERLYLCNFCDESSFERYVLEKHVENLPDLTNRTMTGYKDYYFCDQCMKKFDTEQDMLQHKWTHFLNTNNITQIQPKSILTKRKPEIKTTYKLSEKIPDNMQPFVVLEKIDSLLPVEYAEFVDMRKEIENCINTNQMKKPIVDPKSKKTILSRYQCMTCDKYFSSNYCLNRHIATQHGDFENLRCKVCEETFVWPSLLKSHKCIRLRHPEMPFDDARPEIHFENLTQNGFDDFNIEESDDYMNTVDFEIPAPIVELRECDSTFMLNGVVSNEYVNDKNGVSSSGYKVTMQEVPIEF